MEVPLDGTQYALETGKVRPAHPTDLDVWCMVVDTHFPLYVAALLIFLCFRMIIFAQVLLWCPRSGPVRSVLSMLKKDEPAEDLKVYAVQVLAGKVYAKLFV